MSNDKHQFIGAEGIEEIDDYVDPLSLDDGSIKSAVVPPEPEITPEITPEPEIIPEPEPQPEPEPEPQPEESKLAIPKHRFDEANRKRKLAEEKAEAERAEAARLRRELEILQARGITQPTKVEDFDIDDAELFKLVLDGRTDEASKVFKDVLKKAVSHAAQAARSQIIPEMTQEVESLVEQREASRSVDTVIRNLKTKFPIFDSTKDTFDEDVSRRTLSFQRAYIDEGYSAASALELAAEDAIKLLRPDLLELPEPKEREIQKPTPPARPPIADKKLQAAAVQPPRLTGDVDKASAPKKITELSEKEFDELSREELARLRGDFA